VLAKQQEEQSDWKVKYDSLEKKVSDSNYNNHLSALVQKALTKEGIRKDYEGETLELKTQALMSLLKSQNIVLDKDTLMYKDSNGLPVTDDKGHQINPIDLATKYAVVTFGLKEEESGVGSHTPDTLNKDEIFAKMSAITDKKSEEYLKLKELYINL
jgi:hypothetical protein